MQVDIFTDGACTVQDDTRPGGYGVVLVCQEARVIRKISGSATGTTNNLMELKAITEALDVIVSPFKKEYTYNIYTDSTYALLSIRNRKEYEERKFKKVKNERALKELYSLLDELGFNPDVEDIPKTGIDTISHRNITFIKTEGHSSSDSFEARGNASADKLAVTAKDTLAEHTDTGRQSY